MRKMSAWGAALLALTMLLFWPRAARAFSRVAIRDDAQILSPADVSSIQQTAQRLPFATTVWTTNTRFANRDAFIQAVNGLAGGDRVVIAVQPVQRWSHVATRQNTNLSATQLRQAQMAANAQFGSHAWGAGFTAALNSLGQNAAAGPANYPVNRGSLVNNGYMRSPQPASGGFRGIWILALIAGAIILFMAVARRVMGGGAMGGGMMGGGMMNRTPFGPGMNPGGYGYGPGYNQGGGVNPLVSGGLGALGGGLVGYELGKEAGESDAQNQGYQDTSAVGNQQDFGSGDAGGIVESDTGGSSAPDFGGGGGSDSGGGDFGGGDTGGTDF
ncbi:MAG TPA: hypothetical protein VFJ58_02060 [Armatimonadota bacterium]|nr:hypothetical protein [Armatimonadota bacterium]